MQSNSFPSEPFRGKENQKLDNDRYSTKARGSAFHEVTHKTARILQGLGLSALSGLYGE